MTTNDDPATLTDKIMQQQTSPALELSERIMRRIREADDPPTDDNPLILTDEEMEILADPDSPEILIVDWRGMPRPQREGQKTINFITINTRTGEQIYEYAEDEGSAAPSDPSRPESGDGGDPA